MVLTDASLLSLLLNLDSTRRDVWARPRLLIGMLIPTSAPGLCLRARWGVPDM